MTIPDITIRKSGSDVPAHAPGHVSRIDPVDLILLTTLLLLALTHTLQAGLSFWWDEVFTVSNFVELGPIDAWLVEYHNNNHRLFSMLSGISQHLFGSSEVAYRLPSLGFAFAGYAILTFQVRRHMGRTEALSVGILLLGSPLLLFWIPQARGYGMTIFASVLVLTAGLRIVMSRYDGFRTAIVTLMVGGFIGIATLPHFALPFTLTCAVLAVVRRNVWLPICLAWASTGIASAAFFIPADLSRLAGASGGGFGLRISYLDSILGPFRFQLVGTLEGAGQLEQLIPTSWVWIAITVLVAFLVLAAVRAYRDHNWAPLLLALVPVFGSYSVAAALGLAMTDRTLLFLFPQMSLMFALGIGYFLRPRGERPIWLWLRRAPCLALLPAVAFLAVELAISWSSVPIERYREAATVATQSSVSSIITDSARSLGFTYYAPEVVALDERELARNLCESSDSYAYIEHTYDRGFTPPVSCLRERGATEIKFQQRRRGSMSVWVIPERPSQ